VALEASARAVALAPALAEAHVARALALGLADDPLGQEAAFQEALRLNPRSFDAHYERGRACIQAGRHDEAVVMLRRAAALQEDDVASLVQLAIPMERLGRLAEALEATREGLQRAERLLAIDPAHARALGLASNAHALLGNREAALELARRARASWRDDPLSCMNVAVTYSFLGMKADALDLLESAAREGYRATRWLQMDTAFDGLRGDPRFEALLRGE
jgi:tetratricopeptide (TPR) repeat protein